MSDLAAAIERLCDRLSSTGEEEVAGQVSVERMQDLVAASVRLYMTKVAVRDDANDVPLPCRPENGLTDTDVAIMASKLLESADIDVFELQMWRTLGRDH